MKINNKKQHAAGVPISLGAPAARYLYYICVTDAIIPFLSSSIIITLYFFRHPDNIVSSSLNTSSAGTVSPDFACLSPSSIIASNWSSDISSILILPLASVPISLGALYCNYAGSDFSSSLKLRIFSTVNSV